MQNRTEPIYTPSLRLGIYQREVISGSVITLNVIVITTSVRYRWEIDYILHTCKFCADIGWSCARSLDTGGGDQCQVDWSQDS